MGAAALLWAACASQGGGEATPPGGERGGFQEPGLGDREGGMGGTGPATGSTGGMRTIYFDFDDFSLSGESKNQLKHNASILSSKGDSRVEIQGNCDERGTAEYNLALGKKRAEAARQYLLDLGVAGSRITTVSFGEENPAVPGSGESAWAMNRRDDFVLR
jgi:peptidoglycan-associated lipoprotein